MGGGGRICSKRAGSGDQYWPSVFKVSGTQGAPSDFLNGIGYLAYGIFIQLLDQSFFCTALAIIRFRKFFISITDAKGVVFEFTAHVKRKIADRVQYFRVQ